MLIAASGDAAIDAGLGVKGHDSAVSAAASAAAWISSIPAEDSQFRCGYGLTSIGLGPGIDRGIDAMACSDDGSG